MITYQASRPQANREHKNSVFTTLFGEKDNLLELYSAISGRDYPKDTKIRIVTLSNVLFMERINDICFMIEDKLVVLIEHQSTINENMCLRMLLYIAREYEKITKSRDLYKEKRIRIPAPEFIVLYNGEKEMADFVEMKLSDSFAENDGCFLELVAKVYNINKGRNAEIASRSPVLDGYETFIAEVKENEKTMSLSEAVRVAVKSCMGKDILLNFLKDNASEVENMLLTEWNWDDALAVRYEEGVEEGIGIGTEKGVGIGIDKVFSLLESGMSLEEAKQKLGARGREHAAD